MSLQSIIGNLEKIPENENNFASSAIYRVCLPINKMAKNYKQRERKTTIKRKSDLDLPSLITHVMFEAQLISFREDSSIAIYMRDMTSYVKMKKQRKMIEKLKGKVAGLTETHS